MGEAGIKQGKITNGYEIFLCVKHEEKQQGSRRENNGKDEENGETNFRMGGDVTLF